MLKIKDNVDLKKLEKVLNKYNAQYIYSCNKYTGESYICAIKKKEKLSLFKFNGFNRPEIQEIKYYFTLENGALKSTGTFKDDEDLLYDLIKADLVEKVDD